MDAKDCLFGLGLRYLMDHGQREERARAVLGKLIARVGYENALDVLNATAKANPIEPISYMGRLMQAESERCAEPKDMAQYWKASLASYKFRKHWNVPELGPPPDDERTRVPRNLLIEFGYREKVA